MHMSYYLLTFWTTAGPNAKEVNAIPNACIGDNGYLKSKTNRLGDVLPNCIMASLANIGAVAEIY